MCAIAGILGLPFDSRILDAMFRTMLHRGPDGTGSYMERRCCLLHSRLAIVDPVGGAQPMHLSFAGEEYVITYNGELYKVPIYWGGLLVSTHLLVNFNTNYKRFKRIHNEATSPDPEISGNTPIDGETAKWYRDVYRRYRDYSIVATVAVYLLQVLDANVFAYMHDFEVTDDISMNVEPALISPYNEYAMNVGPVARPAGNAVGMRVGIRF